MNQTMVYRTAPKTDEPLSILGYGCMRFPRKNGAIDELRTESQIRMAIQGGVNYFDTAYIYPGSEKVLGKILEKDGLRNRVKIATKLPVFMVKSRAEMDNLFQKQLQRLRTDRIDYYLLHNIGSFADWQNLKENGILQFIRDEQERGRIKKIGFSFHGGLFSFKQMIDDFDWDFCQIQYNYLDEHFQAGTEGYRYATEKGVGVIVMEPLRGGMLGARIPAEAGKIFSSGATQAGLPNRTPAEWALRWVWSHPGVTVALSGMNEEAHITENIRIASGIPPEGGLTTEESAVVEQVRQFFQKNIKVPCTGCAYCMPGPFGVDIPICFSSYNACIGGIGEKSAARMRYVLATEGVVNGQPSKASRCKSCGACETHCPQHIEIRARLKEAAYELEKAYLRVPATLVMKLLGGKRRQ